MLSDPDFEDNQIADAVSRYVACDSWPASRLAKTEAKRERKRAKRLAIVAPE